MKGGESGAVIVPGKPDESLLWEHVSDESMPPEHPLPAAEKTRLKQWIADGAKWGDARIDPFRFTTKSRAGVDWWSLQPLREDSTQLRGAAAIDHFVSRQLNAHSLAMSKPADKRTLIRRVTFDLTGLPPTLEETQAFLADESPRAYARVVDRLLASPHYGERWARRWLDIVRFGESNGFEYDQPRDNAWHYRNWIINALNRDMPYDEFVRMQLAGDILQPGSLDGAAATGFLVAGAHNTTLPSSQKMRMVMAQDELEDLTGVTGQTFLGLTINCARCHDHKFDPISQKEYYQFAAALAGVTHGERSLQPPPAPDKQQQLKMLDAEISRYQKQLEAIETPVRAKILTQRKQQTTQLREAPQPDAAWDFARGLQDLNGKLHLKTVAAAKVKEGELWLDGKTAFAQTPPLPWDVAGKTLEVWVTLDDLSQRGGGVLSLQTLDGATFDAIVFGEREPGRWMAGSNHFARTRSFNGAVEKATGKPMHFAIVYEKNGQITGYRNGEPYGSPYTPGPLMTYKAGAVQLVLGMRHGPPGSNKMLAGRIQRAGFYQRSLTAEEIAASFGQHYSTHVSVAEIEQHLSDDEKAEYARIRSRLNGLQASHSKLSATTPVKVYTCIGKNPGVSHVLKRGDVSQRGEEAAPASLAAINDADTGFKLPPDASDADRRVKLAEWITSGANPLFSRVMVNRLWQYHFGAGLVRTTSDFGFNGGKPSHPELLDWLAVQFKTQGFRLKPMHRMMVLSRAYCQASQPVASAMQVDAGNRWLWRYAPRRLEAESIRDATLLVAGKLDHAVGGQGYRDVRHFKYKGSNFYEPIVQQAGASQRRTIYRFAPRGGRNPFLDTFDCPDPSATSPRRASTTTPLQALSLLNNPMMLSLSDAFARRVQKQAGEDAEKQVEAAYQLAYGRPPQQEERQAATAFINKHGLSSFCRVVFNSNEFLYVR